METKFSCGRTCAYMQDCRFTALFRVLGHVGRVLSHIVKVNVEIRDLDALRTACGKLGLTLNVGQTTYRWYGHYVGDYAAGMRDIEKSVQVLRNGQWRAMTVSDLGTCTHAISVKGNKQAYEIGLVEQPNGNFVPLWDFWSGGYGLQDKVGKDCKTLIGEYTLQAARNAAVAQSWQYQDNSDGTLTIYHPDGGKMHVHKDGTVDNEGFVGQGCSVASVIENALGRVTDMQEKPEFFLTEHARQFEQG